MTSEQNQVDVLARLQRLERWQETFGDSNKRVKGLYAAEGITVDWDPIGFRRGLGSNFHFSVDPASQSWNAGSTIVENNLFPETPGHYSLLPSHWTIPAKLGDVEPRIRFIFNDTTTALRTNPSGSPLEESPADMYFDQDGKTIVQIQLEVNNNGAGQIQDIGEFIIEGWQV